MKQVLAVLYWSTPLILGVWIVVRLVAKPRRRVRFCIFALLAWSVHVASMFMLILPGFSGHWRPTDQESRLIDGVMMGGVIVVVALVILGLRDRATAPVPGRSPS